MNVDVLPVLIEKLNDMRRGHSAALTGDEARTLTLADLNLDSLEMLQFAMDVEGALNIKIEVVDFPDTITLAQLADQLKERLPQ